MSPVPRRLARPLVYGIASWLSRGARGCLLLAVLCAGLPAATGTPRADAPGDAAPLRLRFPLRGRFAVVAGHGPGEPHADERSQRFALDVVSVGPAAEELRGKGDRNADWVGFGRAVLAPAAGRVVWSRDGYADNAPGMAPGVEFYRSIADEAERRMSIAGNAVVIDHGRGVYSILAHLQRGSVRARTGARVRAGQVVGRVGNSGNSTEPHLHVHLMNGPRLFEADGLPMVFANVRAAELVVGGVYVAE